MLFRNIMNEMYARDISRKVRSAHRIRGNSGEPLGQPPYGYMKAPENKKKWVIEPEAATVVRRIFQMALEGKGNETIAHTLQADKVPVPAEYWKTHGVRKPVSKGQNDPYKWCKSTIAKILSSQEYCGDVINFKTYSKSFKNKSRLENPEENWAVFKNVHEAVIERSVFEQVQKRIGKTKRRAPNEANGEKSMFADLLYEANKMLRFLDTGDMDWGKLTAAVELTDAKSAANIGAVAEHLGEFAYKEASNRKQEIDRQHYTIPNQRPKDKHCGKI